MKVIEKHLYTYNIYLYFENVDDEVYHYPFLMNQTNWNYLSSSFTRSI